ncbi:MAG: hypothetical protein U1A78_36060 [Polyangia bacterium]
MALLLILWPRHEPAVAPTGAVPPSETPAAADAGLPGAAPRPEPSAAPSTAPDAGEADPYGMPPPSEDQIRPRPEQRAPTADEQRQTRQAAIRLVETSITRLADEGRRAEQAGDSETARRNQLRVERLRKRLTQLQQEAAAPPAQPPPSP